MKKIVHLLLMALVLNTSCKKNEANTIKISGQIIDTSSNIGVPNVRINITWETAGMCFFCSTTNIASSKTNNRGEFNINIAVDKSKFEYNYLRIATEIPDGYLNSFGNREKAVVSDISQYISEVESLRLVIYPKANLSVKLVKNQNDNYNYFDLLYKYSPTGLGIFYKSGLLTDTTFTVQTSANIYTKIQWRKSYPFGQTKNFSDSIKCSPITNNVLIINY